MWDVLVIGAGPAGSTLARLLAEGGARVLLLERERVPRVKPCGGAVAARALPYLPPGAQARFEVAVRDGVFSWRGGWAAKERSARPYAYLVRRAPFDAFLAEEAVRRGAELWDGTAAEGICLGAEGVEVATSRGTVRARYAALADGAKGPSRRLLGLPRVRPAAAIEAEIPREAEDDARLSADVEVDYGVLANGYGWIFRKREVLNVGVALMRPGPQDLRRAFFAYALGRLGERRAAQAALLAHPIPLGPPAGRLALGRAVLVGDQAGLADPLSGEGIYYALRSAALAAPALLGALDRGPDALAAYEAEVRQGLGPDLGAARLLAGIFYRLPGPLARRLVSHPAAISEYFGILLGQRTYADYADIVRRKVMGLVPTAVREEMWNGGPTEEGARGDGAASVRGHPDPQDA